MDFSQLLATVGRAFLKAPSMDLVAEKTLPQVALSLNAQAAALVFQGEDEFRVFAYGEDQMPAGFSEVEFARDRSKPTTGLHRHTSTLGELPRANWHLVCTLHSLCVRPQLILYIVLTRNRC